jgi:hypothetical protein
VSNYAAFGTVSPTTVTLAPGASSAVSVTATTPSSAGDASGAVLLNAGHGTTTIPVLLRSLIDVARGGAFSGVLTGGNGRPPGDAQIAYYQFAVGPGRKYLSANLTLANDPGDDVVGYLVAPDGETAGFATNTYITKETSETLDTVNGRGLSLYAIRPAAGRWTLIIDLTSTVGNELADRFAGAVRFAAIPVSASGLPDSAARKLTPGRSVTVPVTIKNTGSAAEDFFVDPRLTSSRTYTLAGIGSPLKLPLMIASSQTWYVPTQTTTLHVTAKASVPVMFDYQPASDDPDLESTSSGDDAAATLEAPFITPGAWNAYPSEIAAGGYPAKGGKAGTVTMTITAVTQAFDPTIKSGPGDFWLGALTSPPPWHPFVIAAGQTRAIDVTIKPSGKAGTVVRGYLYIDDYMNAGQVESGSEITAIPYAYTIG